MPAPGLDKHLILEGPTALDQPKRHYGQMEWECTPNQETEVISQGLGNRNQGPEVRSHKPEGRITYPLTLDNGTTDKARRCNLLDSKCL